MALIFIDLHKAFDNLDWQFLIRQLARMDLGGKFINLITAIYSEQSAKILINNDLTGKINIGKGVRQGCPLAPLLFITVLETLLRSVRGNPRIKGLKIRKEEYKVQAFADDMSYILEDPLYSGTILLEEIEKFGSITGLKINKDKTKIISKNLTEEQNRNLETTLGIQTVKKIKYLGLWLTAKCSTIGKDNYASLTQKIAKDLERWSKLQISFLGKIAAIKMNVLPKILFLFQIAPIRLKKKYFLELNNIIKKFIWSKKKARIKTSSLHDKRQRGGLGLPDWESYYMAASLVWLKEWITLRNTRILTIEGFDLEVGWHAFLWDGKHKTHSYFRRHYIRGPLLDTWLQVKKQHYIKIPKWLSTSEAFIYPNLLNYKKALTYKQILDEQNIIKTRQELKEQGLEIDWWQYLQINTRYNKDAIQFGFQNDHTLDKVILGPDEKMISRLYSYLIDYKLHEEIVKGNMIAWAQNFGYSIMLSEWDTIWGSNYKLTLAATYKENLYKMFYRWHLPPARLAKMFPSFSPMCWKCKKERGTYYHQWWTCPKVKKYWGKIRDWLGEILKKEIPLKPETFLLGILRIKLTKEETYLILHIITAARLIYAQNWKTEFIPTSSMVVRKILDCAEMCKLTMTIHGKEDTQYYKIWNKLYKWIGQNSNFKIWLE